MLGLPTKARSAAGVLVLLVAVVLVVLGLRSAPPGSTHPGALALETRHLAPCCFNGTLDTHDSDLARTLRREIETRVANGEANEAIEADLVGRYGPPIVAMHHEGALKTMLGGAGLLFAVAAILLAWRMRSWCRSSDERVADSKPPGGPRLVDAYDARIDAELAELE